MRTHTNNFKTNIAKLGREFDVLVTYGNKTLGNEEINNCTLNYKGDILKSVMKQLQIDSNEDIAPETEINFKIGILVNGQPEYIDYGNFIVNKSEKQEDTNSYILTCYDKMLYSMIPYKRMYNGYIQTQDDEFEDDKTYYELINDEFVEYQGERTGNPNLLQLYEINFIQYPITIRNYITYICNFLGLQFENASDTFVNYDKEILKELYLDENGNSLDYTFRDVLDELAQVTASTIVINDSGKLEIRYITNTSDTIDENYFDSTNVEFGEQYGPINTITFSRSADSDNISKSIPDDLQDDLKNEIKISDNQILNGNNRDKFIDGILNQLYGLTYYTNDFSSKGILYYDICDKYNVTIGENTYTCIMFNDEININNGIFENIYTEMPKTTKTDYTKVDKTDRKVIQTTLIVDKNNNTITARIQEDEDKLSQVQIRNGEIESRVSSLDSSITRIQTDTSEQINAIQRTLEDGVEKVTNTLVKIDVNGINTSKDNETFNTQITNKTFEVKDGDNRMGFMGFDEEKQKMLVEFPEMQTQRLTNAYHTTEKIQEDGLKWSADYYIGDDV